MIPPGRYAGATTMPSTRITTGAWAQGHEPEVIESVQSALLTSLKIPDWDRDIALDLHDTKTRIVPTGRSERYTRIEVVMFAGRSLDAKRALYEAIVKNLSEIGGCRRPISKSSWLKCRRRTGDCEAVCLPPKSTSSS